MLSRFLINVDEVFKRRKLAGKLVMGSVLCMALGVGFNVYWVFNKGYGDGLERFSIGGTVVWGLIGALVGLILTCFGLAFEKGGPVKYIAIAVIIIMPLVFVFMLILNPRLIR